MRWATVVLTTREFGNVSAFRNVDHDWLDWERPVERVETRAEAPYLDPNDWIGLWVEAARPIEHLPTDLVGLQ